MPHQTSTASSTDHDLGTQTQTQHSGSERTQAPPTGAGVNTGAGITRPKTEAEKEADRRYEEAIEDEYAKREGGA
ncbi:uncharacterized protein P884DRAFT_261116 [Thermothelomyces heterothallicus CBS 202.75]|uniref:uncharacterized protein n=1 Tax=Thermothelomyces heterothallicus CBS 202.75 TaxID=1149848 RepID=UPI0037444A6D